MSSALDIIKSNPKVFVKFGYKGCRPCRILDEIIDEEKDVFSGIKILKCNVTDKRNHDEPKDKEEKKNYKKIMNAFPIEDFDSVPRIFFFTNGKPDKTIHPKQRTKKTSSYSTCEVSINKKESFLNLVKTWKLR